MQYNENDFDGSTIIFLLEIDWMGFFHRFSTIPIVFDGEEYTGSLNEIRFEQSTNEDAIDPQTNKASISCHFDGLDMIQEYRKGRTLEGNTAILSYILLKHGSVYSTSKMEILTGTIQEPIIGDPEEPITFAAFSVEQKPYDLETPIIGPKMSIDENVFPNADESAIGKKYPFIFGQPGKVRKSNAIEQIFATPGYNTKAFGVGSPSADVEFLISGHSNTGTEVQITDGVTAPVTKTIIERVDANGQTYSYIDLTGSTLLYPNAAALANNAESPSEFWITWTNGGGIRSPYRDSVLEGGGDLLRYFLSRSGVSYDDKAFANIAPLLNEYKFAGYVNSSDETTSSILTDGIVPYLPITIQAGPKGLRPVLYQSIALQRIQPITHVIVDDGNWTRIGALETKTDTSQIFNAVRINYAYNGPEDSFFRSVYVGPDGGDTDINKKNLYSSTSSNRYGKSQNTFDANYIYDTGTAIRFCMDYVKRYSFPKRYLRFEAPIEFGFLQLGDVIEITSSDLYMDRQLTTVVSITWDVTNWIIELMFDDSPLHMDRTS